MPADPEYRELFERNYGVFSEEQQRRIREARVLIIGCGGVGGTVAVILARSGVSSFILVDFDDFSITNMNRQIACFVHTLGRNKAEVIAEQIRGINPHARVEVHTRRLSHEEIREIMPRVDVIFPAADDLAFSVFVFRDAQRLGKPALLVVPSGTWANVSMIMPGSPSVEDIEGVPKLSAYEELKEVLRTRKYKYGTYFYVPLADWRIDYYRSFIEEDAPPAQICTLVWTASCLGAMEVLKVISGKWRLVASPRYWTLYPGSIRMNRINGPSIQTLLVWQRRIMWALFQTRLGPLLELGQALWWRLFYAWGKYRERHTSGQ